MDERPAHRDYPKLWVALSQALRTFSRGGAEEDALRESFQAARLGCGARQALLLWVESVAPLRMRALDVKGDLEPEQVRALEEGRDAPGVSTAAVRRALETRAPQVARDEAFSALCAPVPGPGDDTVVAILYFQTTAAGEAYHESEVGWVDGYTRALASALGYHLESRSRERRLQALLQHDSPRALPFREATRRYQREVILARLERCAGDLSAARTSLALPEATLRRYMRRLGIGPVRKRRARAVSST